MAADIPTREPGETPPPRSFGDLLKALREGAGGISQRQAAARCGITQSRWAQVERGYIRGAGDTTGPGVDFVLKVAEGFHQDAGELLKLAGIDPATVRTEPPIDVPPTALMDVWPDLNENEKLSLVIQARLFAYRDSVVTWSNRYRRTRIHLDGSLPTPPTPLAGPAPKRRSACGEQENNLTVCTAGPRHRAPMVVTAFPATGIVLPHRGMYLGEHMQGSMERRFGVDGSGPHEHAAALPRHDQPFLP